jgi:hypothetical protein
MVGAIVGVVLACGAVAAVAATSPSSGHGSALAGPTARHAAHRHAMLAVASAYLGVSKAQLRKDLREGKTLAQVAKETSGKSEAGLIEALVAARKARSAANIAKLERRVRAKVDGVGALGSLGLGAKGGPKAASARTRADFAARNYLGLPAAAYLGLSAAQLQSELQSGETLAQVAKETSGKSEAGLIEALVAARRERLAAAVTAGLLSQSHASAREATLTKRITVLVNRRFSAAGSG